MPLVRVQILINKKHDQQMNNVVSPQIEAFGSKSDNSNLSSCNLSGAYTLKNQWLSSINTTQLWDGLLIFGISSICGW